MGKDPDVHPISVALQVPYSSRGGVNGQRALRSECWIPGVVQSPGYSPPSQDNFLHPRAGLRVFLRQGMEQKDRV